MVMSFFAALRTFSLSTVLLLIPMACTDAIFSRSTSSEMDLSIASTWNPSFTKMLIAAWLMRSSSRTLILLFGKEVSDAPGELVLIDVNGGEERPLMLREGRERVEERRRGCNDPL